MTRLVDFIFAGQRRFQLANSQNRCAAMHFMHGWHTLNKGVIRCDATTFVCWRFAGKWLLRGHFVSAGERLAEGLSRDGDPFIIQS